MFGIDPSEGRLYTNLSSSSSFTFVSNIVLIIPQITDKIIPAGKTGELELRFVCGEKSVPVPANSVIGGQAEWDTYTVNGVAIISGKTLSTSVDVNGVLTVQLDTIRDKQLLHVLCTCVFYIVDYNPNFIERSHNQ